MQQQIRDHLVSDAWFAPLQDGIIVQDKGDLGNQINIQIQRLGVCILILHATGQAGSGNLKSPYFDRIQLALQIAENVTLNRSRDEYKSALAILERSYIRLHHLPMGNGNSLLLPGNFQMIEPPKGATVAYQASFTTSQGIKL